MNFILILIAVWVVAVGGWWILSNAFRSADADRIKSRLLGSHRADKAGKNKAQVSLLPEEDKATGKFVMKIMRRLELQDRLRILLEQAGLKWKPARLIHLCLALFLAGYAIGWLFLPAAYQQLAFLPALLCAWVPILHVKRKKDARLHKFEEQFPESLEFVARSMRAGHAFSVSLEMLHREFQEPLAGEFRRTFEEHNLGLPLDSALLKLAGRVPSLDVQFFVSAVLLQKRTGGNLAEILDKLAVLIRERFKLRGKIKAISAHGRMTGMALSSIPCAVAGFMFVANPEYVTFFLREEVGNYMALGAVGLQVLGYGVIRKIVDIEV